MLFPKVYFTFWRTLFNYLFGINKGSPFYCLTKNLYSTSFRIGENDRKKFLFALSFPIGQIVRAKIGRPSDAGSASNGICIYDNSRSVADLRMKYVEFHAKGRPDLRLFKQEMLFFSNSFSKVIYILLALPFIFLLFLLSIFKKDKAPFALITVELIENYNLLKLCRANKVKEVFFFSIYEKDANIAAWLLMKNKVKVTKVSSEVPLSIWNSTIITDKLAICLAYQLEEIKYFSNSMFIKETELWGPERMMDVHHLYSEGKRETKPNTLGFYSTATWVRKLEGHIDQGFDMEASENELKKMIKEYSLVHPELQLIIYLHPKERSEKYLSQAEAHYARCFDGVKFSFAPFTSRSSELFGECDVALAFVTTLMYERIYFGYKSIFMPIAIKGFPLKGSSIENICVNNKDELFKKLGEAFALSTLEYFKKNKLENYVMKLQ